MRTAIVVGASSGVGAATARALAAEAMDVAVVARRAARLEALAAELTARCVRAFPIAADVQRSPDAERAMLEAHESLGRVDVLVYATGTNVPRRRLDQLSIADWDTIVHTNLSGAFYCLRPLLPVMRGQGEGLTVFISSIAGLRPSALSGAAYSASKAGLDALSAVINLEEGDRGLRAAVISPGDINTEILERRPQPPSEEQRRAMLQPEDVAEIVVRLTREPDRVLTEQVVVRPRR
jgi:NADP-dependent 3-hydroxy acid dehydrogenase YdfG